MKFSVSKLLIWPRDSSKEPRVVSFAETGISLITGASRSGKSAIIKIIDYCLGSKACSIPKMGPIRRSSAWYGIVILTEEGYKFLGRQDPGTQESTDEYMLTESLKPIFPGQPLKNANRSDIKALLARLARLPQANADFNETGSGFKGRASFGDMTSFVFQPQPIVANDRVLFFEADDEEHARKLREIFPLVLGAVDADTLVKQHRLADVRRFLERRRRQLEVLSSSKLDYAGEVRGRYLSAIDLGLLQADVASIEHAEIGVLLTRLRDLVTGWLEGRRPETASMTFNNAPRLAELRESESFSAQQVASLRLRQVQLRELSQARLLSESVLARERDRLSPASWLIEEVSRVGSCPFCGSENHSGTIELERLRQRAAAVESQWQGIAAVPAMLDAEEVELRRARDQEEERLYQIRAERASVEQLTSVARKADEERALFIGKLVEFLAAQGSLSSDSDRMKEIEELEAEEQRLQAQVDTDVIAQRKEDALLIISRYAQHYGRLVELENNDAVIKLDTRELSIRVLNDRGESAWLYQIGSGANHLGYHVATMLALHEFFIRRPIYYVPSLLIVDQPSQTQFADESAEEDEQEELLAVHKAFEAFDSAIDRTNGMLQVIVSEHAGKTVYAGIRHLTVVERWRRGRKLIPWHWMDEQAMGELDGKRADWAFEDLLEKIIRPAFVSALELSEALEILELNIESAIFENLGIAFEVRVAVNRKQAFGTQMEGRSREAVIKGSIRQDLSVSIDEVQNFS